MAISVNSEGRLQVQPNLDTCQDDDDPKASGIGVNNTSAPKAGASVPSQGIPFYAICRSADLPATDASVIPPPANSAANSVDAGKLSAKLNDSDGSDLYAAMGQILKLWLETSQQAKKEARQQRSAELGIQISQALASADEIEKAGKDRMVAAIVQGGMSALGGMAQLKGGYDATKAGAQGVVDTQKFLQKRDLELQRDGRPPEGMQQSAELNRQNGADLHPQDTHRADHNRLDGAGRNPRDIQNSDHGGDQRSHHIRRSDLNPEGGGDPRLQDINRADMNRSDGQDLTVISARLNEGEGKKAMGMAVSQLADAAGKSGSAPVEYEATVHDKEKEVQTANSKRAEDGYSQSNDLVHSQADLISSVLDAFKQMVQLQAEATQNIVSHV